MRPLVVGADVKQTRHTRTPRRFVTHVLPHTTLRPVRIAMAIASRVVPVSILARFCARFLRKQRISLTVKEVSMTITYNNLRPSNVGLGILSLASRPKGPHTLDFQTISNTKILMTSTVMMSQGIQPNQLRFSFTTSGTAHLSPSLMVKPDPSRTCRVLALFRTLAAWSTAFL